MKRTVKTVLAGLLTVAMSMSILSGCSGKDCSADVLDLTEPYMDAVLSRTMSKISKLSTPDFKEDYKEQWSKNFDFDSRDRDAQDREILEAISDTISYEIDEDSATANSKYGEGSVDITVEMVDYKAMMSDYDIMESAASFKSAIEDEKDYNEINITIEFDLVNGKWLVSNHEEILSSIYGFTTQRFEYFPDLSTSIYGIDIYSYSGASDIYNHILTNPTELTCYIDYVYGTDLSQIRCEILYNGTLIMTTAVGCETFDIYATDTAIPNDSNRTDCMAAGTYTFNIYDGRNQLVNSSEYEVVITTYRPYEGFMWFFETTDCGSYAIYNNATELDLDISGHYNDPDIYYTVSMNGEIVYTSPTGRYEGYYYSNGTGDIDWDAYDYNVDCVAPGIYEIMFYNDATGECYGGSTAIVFNNNKGEDGTRLGGFIGFDFIGDAFSTDMYYSMGDPCWVMPDGSTTDFGYYDSGVSSITLSVPVDYDFGDMEFYVEYSADGSNEYSFVEIGEPQIISVTEADGSYSYEFVFSSDSGALDDGYYAIRSNFTNGDDFVASYCRVGESPAQ